MGSALFWQAAPDSFGAFDLAFFTLFRITAGKGAWQGLASLRVQNTIIFVANPNEETRACGWSRKSFLCVSKCSMCKQVLVSDCLGLRSLRWGLEFMVGVWGGHSVYEQGES